MQDMTEMKDMTAMKDKQQEDGEIPGITDEALEDEDEEFGSAGLLDDDLALLAKKRLTEGEQGVVALTGITVTPKSTLDLNHPTVM